MEWGDSLNWVASASTLRDTLKKSIASQDHVNHLVYEVIIDEKASSDEEFGAGTNDLP